VAQHRTERTKATIVGTAATGHARYERQDMEAPPGTDERLIVHGSATSVPEVAIQLHGLAAVEERRFV
jgi:hypothetical protein